MVPLEVQHAEDGGFLYRMIVSFAAYIVILFAGIFLWPRKCAQNHYDSPLLRPRTPIVATTTPSPQLESKPLQQEEGVLPVEIVPEAPVVVVPDNVPLLEEADMEPPQYMSCHSMSESFTRDEEETETIEEEEDGEEAGEGDMLLQ